MSKVKYDDTFDIDGEKQPDLDATENSFKPTNPSNETVKEQRKINLKSNIVLGFGALFFIVTLYFLCYFFLCSKSCTGEKCESCFAFSIALPVVIAPLLFLLSIIPFILASSVTVRLEKVESSSMRKRIRLKNRIGLGLLLLSTIMVIIPCVVIFSLM